MSHLFDKVILSAAFLLLACAPALAQAQSLDAKSYTDQNGLEFKVISNGGSPSATFTMSPQGVLTAPGGATLGGALGLAAGSSLVGTACSMAGAIQYDSTTNAPAYCNGASWSSFGPPSGAVMAFALSSCPAGWVAADGSGGTTDMRGRTIIGYGQGNTAEGGGTGTNYEVIGATGGAETHTLTIPELPVFHLYFNDDGPGTANGLAATGPSGQGYYAAQPPYGGVTGTGAPTSDIGGNQPHTIMMPYTVLLWCQKS